MYIFMKGIFNLETNLLHRVRLNVKPLNCFLKTILIENKCHDLLYQPHPIIGAPKKHISWCIVPGKCFVIDDFVMNCGQDLSC